MKSENIESQDESNRRRGFLINPEFQWSFIRHCLGLAAIILLVVFAANSLFFWSLHNMGQRAGLDPTHIFFRFLAQQQSRMLWIFIGTSGIVASTILSFGLRLSHRIAGPLFKLDRFLKDPSKARRGLRFRTGDYFPELAESANEALRPRAKVETKKASGE